MKKSLIIISILLLFGVCIFVKAQISAISVNTPANCPNGSLACLNGTAIQPTIIPPITRSVGNCPLGYGDMYWNSPINTLPVSAQSPAQIASLGQANLWPSPEFVLNVVTNSTPTIPSYQMIWNQTNPTEFESGNYPINPTSLISIYLFGSPITVVNNNNFIDDNHILMLNTDTCNLYETYQIFNNVPPYHLGTGTIINLKDYNLRTAYKFTTFSIDSAGDDNGTASGLPIWPLILTHQEIFGSGNATNPPTNLTPIVHAVHLYLSQTQVSPGYQWPATHAAGGKNSNELFTGATFRLKSSFDSNICRNSSNNGLLFPVWFQNVLKSFQIYGFYFADNTGNPGGFGTDADQAWGDPNLATSDNWIFAGWTHCIQLSDLEVVDNTPRMISVTSGQVNQNFIPR